MRPHRFHVIIHVCVLIIIALIFMTCSSGIEPSPDPAILRVILESDSTDNVIIVAEDTMYASAGDSMQIAVFQGKAYSDTNFAILFQNLEEYFSEDHKYNILRRDNGQYKKFVIFESLIPPGDYTKLQFGITAEYMLLSYGYYIGGIGIPMESPPGTSLLVDFETNYTMTEGRTTEIRILLKPFQSVARYRDILHFVPQLSIASIENF